MRLRILCIAPLLLLIVLCLAGTAKAVSILADTAVTAHIAAELEGGAPPEGTRFPLVYYLVDNGMGAALTLRYKGYIAESVDTSTLPDMYRHPEKRTLGVLLPMYLGYITVNADYSMTFTEACDAGSYVKIFLDGYQRPYMGTRIPNAERTAKVAHDSWNGVMVVLDALKKNGTLIAIYKTSGLPPAPTFRPEFTKTTIVLLDVLRSVTFTPPYDAVDARITNPLPGMTLEFLATPNTP